MAKLLAIALKSFSLGKEIKTRTSAPFEVEEHLFNELKQNGLVDHAQEKDTQADPEAKAKEEAEAKVKEETAAKAKAKA